MANKSKGSTDSELLGNMTDGTEGLTNSELLGNVATQSESSTDSVLFGDVATQTEVSTDSVQFENVATQTEGSTNSVIFGNVATQTEGSTNYVLFGNVTTQTEGSTDSVLFGNMGTESEGSCAGNESSKPKSVHILFLGDIGIGKTTLIKSYLGATNIDVEELGIHEVDDIFAVYPLRMKHNEKFLDFGLIDLHSGANSRDRRECYPVDVNVIILCFSIGHYRTLKSVYDLWIHEIRSHFSKLTPVLLVGLRSDVRLIKPGTLGPSIICQEGNRVVEKCEAEAIHQNYQFHGDYMECSNSDTDSVIHVIEKAFEVAMEDIIAV